jgi:hypothetical protein
MSWASRVVKSCEYCWADFTQTTPAPPTKSAPKKPRKPICLSTTCRAVRHRARKCGFTLKSRDNAYRLMVGTEIILAGTLECISAYLAVQDVPSKPTPPRILSTTYDAIAKRARRRAYIVRKTRLGYTMTRGKQIVAPALCAGKRTACAVARATPTLLTPLAVETSPFVAGPP